MRGVWRTRVGYAGGTLQDPTYHHLGDHTECFQVDFDPAVLPYERLLDLFWASHNPCAGSWSRQYRSAIFADPDQLASAEASRCAVAARRGEIRTPILPLDRFYRAEDYHQKWELRNDALMDEFRALLPDETSFADSSAAARVNAALGGHLDPDLLRSELPLYGLSPAAQARLLR